MADFTLSAPGTTNTPWSPAGVIFPVSTVKSDATGFRASTAGVSAAFAHNVTYGNVVTTTITFASGGTSNGDDALIGIVVRSGVNAGAGVGMQVLATTVKLVSWSNTLTTTNISATLPITRGSTDTWTITTTLSGGTFTITNVTQNAGAPMTFSANTTTALATETTLAAGAGFLPFNSDLLYFGQFTGTGVAGVTSFTLTANSGTFAMTGEAATLSAPGGATSFTLLANSGTFNMSGATSTTSVGINAVTGLFAFLPQNASLNWPQGGLVDTGVFGYKNVFVLGSNTGLVQWVDYIPVQFLTVTADKVDRYVPGGALACKALGSVTGLTKWVDYIPVFVTSNTGTFRTDDTGYIPMVKLV